MFAYCGLLELAAVDFGLQWFLWIFSAYFKTEKFYDLAGSGTFALLAALSCWRLPENRANVRPYVHTAFILVWSLRLGSYLFTRIMKDGHDKRFDKARNSPALLFVYWTMQGVWVIVTLLPTLLMEAETHHKPLGWQDYTGWSLWVIGFVFEVTADYQKSQFRADPINKGEFIKSGLWSISRHPNYFGEVLLWFGLYIASTSVFHTWWQHLSVLSPVFLALLITLVSGIPLLEKGAEKRWGHREDYQAYVKKTSVFVPYLG